MAALSPSAFAVGGVVVAGLLAAAANVGALTPTTAVPSDNAAATVDASPSSSSSETVDPFDPLVLEVVVDPSADPATATPTVASNVPSNVNSNVTVYRLDDAGSVAVAASDGVVAVTEVVPADGWTAAAPDDGLDSSAYAVFSDDTVVVEFRVVLADGALVPTIAALPVG